MIPLETKYSVFADIQLHSCVTFENAKKFAITQETHFASNHQGYQLNLTTFMCLCQPQELWMLQVYPNVTTQQQTFFSQI